MRIDKFLSQLKYTSRSDCQHFLRLHEVCVDHRRIFNQRENLDPLYEKVTVDGILVFYKDPIHLMMYKPQGYLSANKDQLHPCVTDLMMEPYHRFEYSIAGRLDLDAEGLLILSTDGHLIHDIISPKKVMPKIYEVLLDRSFEHDQELINGVHILDGKNETYLAQAVSVENFGLRVQLTITEGKFHQVKRMFKAVGYEVLNLKRIQIGALKLGDLKEGQYKEFNVEDLYD